MKMKNRFLGILLSLSLVLGLMPGMSLTAYAAGEKAYAAYDVTTETNKTKSGNDLTALQVAFNGRQWYIIEDNSLSATSGTVTLLSADTSFGTKTFDNASNKYSTSQVKAYLDSMTGTGGAFADVADAIETFDLTTNQYDSTEVYETVNGVKLYLLSTEEANSLPRNVRMAEFTGGNCSSHNEWWLRSPGEVVGRAAFVYGDYGDVDRYGGFGDLTVPNAFGVRPALKLDLSKVTFDSVTNTFSVGSVSKDPVSYMAWDETEKKLVEKTGDDACTDYTVVTADTTAFENGTWYVVSNSVTVSSRITVTGTAHLILCDGAILTASKGITVSSENTLNIYAQSEGTGELSAGNTTSAASIGGGARYQSSGTVNIHGGKITASGGTNASGIGGAMDGGNGEVNVYGGEVIAKGQNYAAGIGGYSGKSGGTVNIYGGTVNASGSLYGTTGIGIGGLAPGSCVVNIYGGEVTATSEKAAAGIQGTVTIDGGTVTANGGVSEEIDASSGETYSSNGINGKITINGGTVTATGGNVTANGYMGAIESTGGTIYACSGINGTVTISGGTVTATGGNVTGDIYNYRYGTIYACNGVNGTVTISGGTVTATGGSHTGKSSGTTVKEKGFGGSLTIGDSMKVFGGDNADPTTEIEKSNDDYARFKYMLVKLGHVHSFTYEANDATIKATCSQNDCTLPDVGGNHTATLTIAAPTSLTYNGSAKAAVITDANHIQGTANVQYQTKNGDSYGTATETAPTDPGTYKASITLGEATASVEYTITATPLTITGATLTSRAYAKDNKNVDVTAVTFSGGTPTIGTDYTATAEMADDTAGDSKAVTVTVTLINPNYSLATNTFNTTVNISKKKPATPAAPTTTSITDTSVTLTATEGYQYKRDDTDWQDSNEFTGLTEDTSYSFYQRVKGDANHSDSDSSAALTIKTKQEPISYAEYNKSGNFIVITKKTITEYIKAQTTNNTVWLNDGDFYVVKGDVTLTNGLVYSGNVSILLCDNSKLTIIGGIWHYGSELTIYGQSGQSGEIVVEGDKNITLDNVPSEIDASTISKDSALNGGKIHINGGKLSITPDQGQKVCGETATVDFLSNESFTGTKEGGTQETLTEGSYGAAKLNEFTGFEAKPVATVTAAPTAKTGLTANGSAQALVYAGTANGGTMQYALGSLSAATGTYSETIPTAIAAGTYYVWYKVVGDENHKDSEPACVTVEISNTGSSGDGSNDDAVQAVINKINALDPSASDYAAKVQEAVDAYNALTDSQKNDDRLKDQTVVAKLADAQQAAADKKAVDEANALICKLPDNPKQAAEADAQAAYKAYMELSGAQKALLSDDAKKKAAVYGYYYEAQYAKAQKAKLTSVKAKKGKKAAAKWKAVSGVSGYQLYYKAKGTKAKKVTIKSAKTLKRTVKKLKAGKKYTFKVRTFTKIYDPAKDKNVRVYGKWSKAKKIRAKK